MINQAKYDCILEILSREPSFKEGKRHLEKRWPGICDTVSEKTLKSIQAQYYVRRMRRCHHHHYSRETREKYYKLYKEAKRNNEKNVIMRLAAKNDISPCLLARIILEEYYWNDVDHGREKEKGDGRLSLPAGFMTDCIRDIAKLPNPELAGEIYETIVLDNFYGPAVDSIKKTCGVEYEMILKAHCKRAGLSFIDEDQMREDGYDKTPDIKLKIPTMINNRVVNWIESKASFGDPINHQQYMIDQYLPYKNRFGPGAVIYWFGFVAELAENGERGVLLLDKFPEAEQITSLKDVHEQEKVTLGFQSLQWKNNEISIDNKEDDDDEEKDRFYNYVDPMFDSDEDDFLGFDQGGSTDNNFVHDHTDGASSDNMFSESRDIVKSAQDAISEIKIAFDNKVERFDEEGSETHSCLYGDKLVNAESQIAKGRNIFCAEDCEDGNVVIDEHHSADKEVDTRSHMITNNGESVCGNESESSTFETADNNCSSDTVCSETGMQDDCFISVID